MTSLARRISFGVLLLVAVAASRAAAQSVTVSGVVVRGDVGTPLAGATVHLSDRAATTDAVGRFRFDSVRAGSHTVVAQAIGYRLALIDVSIAADTTLQITLERIPTELDTVRTVERTITVSGRIRDSVTQVRLLRAQVRLYPNGELIGANSGSFRVPDIPAGEVALVVEGFHHLPKWVIFETSRDTSIVVDLAVDSVALRMTAEQVRRLALRARAVPIAQRNLNRSDIEISGAITVTDLLHRQMPAVFDESPPFKRSADKGCIFYDDRLVKYPVLFGLPMETIERVEIFGARGQMVRVYSTEYVASLARAGATPNLMYAPTGLSTICS